MAEKQRKINFYPKPTPPTKPRVKSFDEIQRLLAKAPAPPTHEPVVSGKRLAERNRLVRDKRTHIDGPKKTAIQCTNRGTHQFR